jgi:tRNA dimethylallyltransferase
LHAELAQLDPEAAARINPHDPQRIQRALEVHALTGQSLTHLQQAQYRSPLPYRALKLVVCPGQRSILHQRIEQRFDAMLSEGFEEELRMLHARADLGPDLPSMRAVGYRQGWAWLDGEFGRDEMRLKAIYATRQLAKRQLTWLRREPECLWYDLGEDKALGGVMSTVDGFLEL